MADQWAYVSTKISGDDVESALKEAKEKAIDKLGSKEIELFEKSWTPDWLCTTWRLQVPDPPPPPP